ncbi:50S ribosomal protein L24 [Patescibacteria group bacterium]|nr:50S ribosomal protein L24 [Patescibacteria group bacterium]
MRIKNGDTVFIKAGKDKGRKGKVIKALPKEGKIVVEGINIRKKHLRPKKQGEKGQIGQIPTSFDISNVLIICEKCGKAVRIGYKIMENKKVRICKKCNAEI